jgi:hypothetical protein
MPRRLVSVISAAAVAAAFGVAGSAAVPAGALSITTCPAISGPAWTEAGSGKNGTTYVVQVFSTTCANAMKLVPHLDTQKIKRRLGSFYVVPKPPAGEACAALPDTAKRAFEGHCYPKKGSPTAVPLFIWGPQGG